MKNAYNTFITECRAQGHIKHVKSLLSENVNQFAEAIQARLPEGWVMVRNPKSVTLRPKQDTLPSVKVTECLRVEHDWGTKKAPKSQVLKCKSQAEALSALDKVMQFHSVTAHA